MTVEFLLLLGIPFMAMLILIVIYQIVRSIIWLIATVL